MKESWHNWHSRQGSQHPTSAPATRIPHHVLAYVFALLCVGCSGLTRIPDITTSQVPAALAGARYSARLAAKGGIPPYGWALAAGTLPPGVALDPKTGTLSGVPARTGIFSFTVAVHDSTQPKSAMGMRGLSLTVAGPAPQIITAALPNAQAGAPFEETLGAAGGAPPYHWAIVSGALPAALSLNDTGLISGTPAQPGQFDFTVQLSDSSPPKAQTAMKALRLVVVTLALQIFPGDLPDGEVGVPFRATLSASGGVAPYTWSVTGALPSGLGLSASSGAIAGTPTAAGEFSFTVRVEDSASPPLTVSKAFSLSIADASASSALDQYGGDAKHPCAGTMKDGKPIPGPTGFFYLYKDTNLKHWMFCDPLGNRFWMLSVESIDCTMNCSLIKGGWSQELRRLQSLGFNTVGELATNYAWPIDVYNRGDGGNAHKMPFIYNISPAFYYYKYGLKEIIQTLPPAYTDWRGSTFADIFDPLWTSKAIPKWLTGGPADYGSSFTGGISNADASPWLIGVTEDDSDVLWGFKGYDGPYPHLGWMVGMAAPYQGRYPDTAVHIKQQLSGYLQTKYATIGALNTAWVSNYSSFGSSATTVTGEAIGTGNGSQTSFTHTLAHAPVDPLSISVFVSGVLQGGDCPWFNIVSCSGTSGIGKMASTWDGTGTVNGGTVTYSSGVLTVTFSSAPANGAAITANYRYAGWPKATSGGTGLLDEDGTSSWWPTENSFSDPPAGTLRLDLDGFLGQIAKQYFSTIRASMATNLPHHLLFGPNPLGPHTRAVVLAQAAQYLDAFMFFGMQMQDSNSTLPYDGRTPTTAAYNTYGIPIFAYELKNANPESPYTRTCGNWLNGCFSTQHARGQSYRKDMLAYFNTYVGADGYGFVVGSDFWQYFDNSSELQNFGLITLKDNLYNGIESCGKSVVDPWGFTTTPEPTTGCYGDFVGSIKAGNRIWLGP